MKYLKYLVLILCFLSCKEKDQAPLNQEQFASILFDIHSVQGYKSISGERRYSNDEVDEFEASILQKHNIDKALFDSCVIYYARHIHLYEEVYESVIDSLNRSKSKFDAIIASNHKRDTLNIWPGKDSLSFKEDSIKCYECRVPFRKKGLYKIALKVKVGINDKGKRNRLIGFLGTSKDSLIAFDTIKVNNDTLWHNYYMKAITDSLCYDYLYFKLMDCDNIDSLVTREVIIKDIKLTNPIFSKLDANILELNDRDILRVNR